MYHKRLKREFIGHLLVYRDCELYRDITRDMYKIRYIFPTIPKFLMIQKPLKFADVRRLYDTIPRYVRLVARSVFYSQRTTRA